MPELEPGLHTLKIKAWDVLNNSKEVVLDFTVAKDEELELSHVLNYPNPFTTKTQFRGSSDKLHALDRIPRLEVLRDGFRANPCERYLPLGIVRIVDVDIQRNLPVDADRLDLFYDSWLGAFEHFSAFTSAVA